MINKAINKIVCDKNLNKNLLTIIPGAAGFVTLGPRNNHNVLVVEGRSENMMHESYASCLVKFIAFDGQT